MINFFTLRIAILDIYRIKFHFLTATRHYEAFLMNFFFFLLLLFFIYFFFFFNNFTIKIDRRSGQRNRSSQLSPTKTTQIQTYIKTIYNSEN
jgi:hypothetical protein